MNAEMRNIFESGAAYSETIKGHGKITLGLRQTADLTQFYAVTQLGLEAPKELEGSKGDLEHTLAACQQHLDETKAIAAEKAGGLSPQRQKELKANGGVRWGVGQLSRKARGSDAPKVDDAGSGGSDRETRAKLAEVAAELAELRQAINVRLDDFDARIAATETAKAGKKS
jgi:hypothetical protein